MLKHTEKKKYIYIYIYKKNMKFFEKDNYANFFRKS